MVAIYPGSFDPVTNGHLDIIKKASRIFSSLIVAVLCNPAKDPPFSQAERAAMIEAEVAGFSNVFVEIHSGLLAPFAVEKNACAIVRGARNYSDFEIESNRAAVNRELTGGIETLLLFSDPKLACVSGGAVREIALSDGGAESVFMRSIVPASVAAALRAKFTRTT